MKQEQIKQESTQLSPQSGGAGGGLSQNEMIKNHLQSGKTLTALQALRKFNCLRLSGRIYDLTHDHGLPIRTEIISVNGKHVARYSLNQHSASSIQ